MEMMSLAKKNYYYDVISHTKFAFFYGQIRNSKPDDSNQVLSTWLNKMRSIDMHKLGKGQLVRAKREFQKMEVHALLHYSSLNHK